MENLFLTLVPIFGIMLIGVFSERFELLPKETTHCLGQYIYWYGIPMLLFYLMATSEIDEISTDAILACVFAITILILIVFFTLRFFKLSYKEAWLGSFVASFSNAFFMGLPLIILLYPDNNEAITAAALFAILITIVYVIIDILLGIEISSKKSISKEKSFLAKLVKNVCTNPGLIAVFFGCIIGLGDISFPNSLLEISRMIGSTASPCALFCMGISLYTQIINIKKKKEKIENFWKVQSVLLISKFILMPLLVFVFLSFTSAGYFTIVAMTIMAGLPSGISCHVVALRHNAMPDQAANAILISTILSIFVLPILIFILK